MVTLGEPVELVDISLLVYKTTNTHSEINGILTPIL
jgi:hypothetical protein